MAGMAFTNTSLGINHSMAHTVGGNFHIPHGRANAIILPYVIKYNANLESGEETEAGKRYVNLSRILGLPCSSISEGVKSIIVAIKILMKATNIPMNLKELNIDKNDFLNKLESMVDDALNDKCTDTNPIKPSKEELTQLFQEIYGE